MKMFRSGNIIIEHYYRKFKFQKRPHDFKSLDELLDSIDHALSKFSPCTPSTTPAAQTNCLQFSLRKLTRGLTIPQICSTSSLMRKNFLIRVLYTDVY